MKGQHVGGRSSDKSYRSHWRLRTATNLETSSDNPGGGGGQTGRYPGRRSRGFHIKLPQPLTIEFRWHRLFPNILGYDMATNRPQTVKQDIGVHLARARGGGGGTMQKTSPVLALQDLNYLNEIPPLTS